MDWRSSRGRRLIQAWRSAVSRCLLALWRFYASGARSKDFTKIKLMMKLTRVSTGNIHSWLRRFNEHSFQLLGRLYIFAAIYTIESVSVIGALHIKSAFHPGLIPVAIVSFAVFLGLGYPWLKVQREELSFGFISFGGYVACVVVTIGLHMLTVMQGAGFRFSYAVAVAVSAIYLRFHVWRWPAFRFATGSGCSVLPVRYGSMPVLPVRQRGFWFNLRKTFGPQWEPMRAAPSKRRLSIRLGWCFNTFYLTWSRMPLISRLKLPVTRLR